MSYNFKISCNRFTLSLFLIIQGKNKQHTLSPFTSNISRNSIRNHSSFRYPNPYLENISDILLEHKLKETVAKKGRLVCELQRWKSASLMQAEQDYVVYKDCTNNARVGYLHLKP